MNRFVSLDSITGLPYKRTDYTLLELPTGTVNFVQATAAFFVQSWMSSTLSHMLNVWKNWDSASEEDRLDYRSYLDVALFSSGKMIDDPSNGYTGPIATFAETMLRWLRQSFAPTPLLVGLPYLNHPATEKLTWWRSLDFPKTMPQ